MKIYINLETRFDGGDINKVRYVFFDLHLPLNRTCRHFMRNNTAEEERNMPKKMTRWCNRQVQMERVCGSLVYRVREHFGGPIGPIFRFCQSCAARFIIPEPVSGWAKTVRTRPNLFGSGLSRS